MSNFIEDLANKSGVLQYLKDGFAVEFSKKRIELENKLSKATTDTEKRAIQREIDVLDET